MKRYRAHISRQDNEPESINLSPLIDMIFILLIFFIVTTVFVEETGVEVRRPEAASAVDLDQQSVLIAITAEGAIYYGGREIGTGGVRTIVQRINQREPSPVIIQADRTVPTELLLRVIDEANLGGAPSVHLSTDRQ